MIISNAKCSVILERNKMLLKKNWNCHVKDETRGSDLLLSDTPHHFNKHIRINLWQLNRLFL